VGLKCLELTFSGSPILRSPMHVRTYSSTSPLSRRYIGYREIAISNATIPLSLEIPKCQTPTPRDPLTRVPADGRFKTPVGISRIAIPTCKRFLSPGTPILRIATLRDLSTPVPQMDGPDCIGKSWIATSYGNGSTPLILR
jgi:hypothetical protein